jgi:hypothetical protein
MPATRRLATILAVNCPRMPAFGATLSFAMGPRRSAIPTRSCHSICGADCRLWVIGGKPRSEHIFSGCPPIADLRRRVAVHRERIKPLVAALENQHRRWLVASGLVVSRLAQQRKRNRYIGPTEAHRFEGRSRFPSCQGYTREVTRPRNRIRKPVETLAFWEGCRRIPPTPPVNCSLLSVAFSPDGH